MVIRLRERERESIEPDDEFDKGRDSKIVFDTAFHRKSNRSFCENSCCGRSGKFAPSHSRSAARVLTLKVKQSKEEQSKAR